MRGLFSRKIRSDNWEMILSIVHEGCIFVIEENDQGSFVVHFEFFTYLRKNIPVWSDKETLPCSRAFVDEVFLLLKDYNICDLIEEVKQSEFRDIEVYPGSLFAVQYDYAGQKCFFRDDYGCSYEKSCDPKIQLCMRYLMLKLVKLFFLEKQGKL